MIMQIYSEEAMNFEYDQIPRGYYDQIYRCKRGVQSRWHHEKFACVREALPSFSRLVDIGCGPGTFLGSLGHISNEAIGIDAMQNQLAYAQDHFGNNHVRFINATRPPYPIDSNSVDVVTMIELIEHLDLNSIKDLLAEVWRLLLPGGEILLTTPNYASLWPILELIVNKKSNVSYEHQHITHFDRHKLHGMLTEAGFEVQEVTAFMFTCPFVAIFGWKAADVIGRLEPRWISRRAGFLLFARARKPA